jgi:hypothetical protein
LEAWTGLWFTVLALSSFRITRLLVEDSILDRPRIWLAEQLGGEMGVAERLLSCPWCAGIWVSGAVVVSALFWPPSLYLHAALALAAVAGLIASADSAMHKDAGLKVGDRSEPPEETSINSGEERPDPVGALVRNLARETVHVGSKRPEGG